MQVSISHAVGVVGVLGLNRRPILPLITAMFPKHDALELGSNMTAKGTGQTHGRRPGWRSLTLSQSFCSGPGLSLSPDTSSYFYMQIFQNALRESVD